MTVLRAIRQRRSSGSLCRYQLTTNLRHAVASFPQGRTGVAAALGLPIPTGAYQIAHPEQFERERWDRYPKTPFTTGITNDGSDQGIRVALAT